MRTYTELDKIIINKIIELYHDNDLIALMNLLFDINSSVYGLTASFYFSSNERNTVTLNIHKGFYDKLGVYDVRDYIPKTINTMTLIIRLLKHLEDNDYVLLHPEQWEFKLGIADVDSTYIQFDDFNSQLKEEIFRIGNSTFIPTEKLLVLQKNDFMDEDSLREKSIKNQNSITNRLSIAAIILSMVTLVTSSAIGYLTMNNANNVTLATKSTKVEFNTDRIIEVEKRIEEVIKQLNLIQNKN